MTMTVELIGGCYPRIVDGETVIATIEFTTREETIARALKFAASDDMLAALEATVARHQSTPNVPSIAAARAAIARARGGK